MVVAGERQEVTVVTVALDGMGGDYGAAAAVGGAARASLEVSNLHVLLVGPLDAMQRALEAVPHDPRRITVLDSGPAIPMEADPRLALERWPRASIAVAAEAVREGRAAALVSAGHTGATVLTAARTLPRLEGVNRAALAAVIPTEAPHGPRQDPFALMLDVGATLHVSARDLVQFAVLGAAYSSVISEIQAPSVALLSNGAEPGKGPPEVVEAWRALSSSSLRFMGNAEGLDIPRGAADVFVCEGFVGNVVLKMLEGVAEVVQEVAEEAATRRLRWRVGLGLLRGGIRHIKRVVDWERYGGAPLLGLEAVVLKAHGRSGPGAIRNALKVAVKAVHGDLAARARAGLERQEEWK